MKSTKVIHTSDLHLGTTFKKLGDASKLHRIDCQNALSKIVDLCIKEKADALLIAGDPSYKTQQFYPQQSTHISLESKS